MLEGVRRSRFRRLPHLADCRLLVWGQSEEEFLANAVAAAMRVALGRTLQAPPERWFSLRPWPRQHAQRLVRTVNEALYLLYTRRLVTTAFRLDEVGRLGTVALGHRTIVNEVKAATFHDLRPAARGGRLVVRLTLDL